MALSDPQRWTSRRQLRWSDIPLGSAGRQLGVLHGHGRVHRDRRSVEGVAGLGFDRSSDVEQQPAAALSDAGANQAGNSFVFGSSTANADRPRETRRRTGRAICQPRAGRWAALGATRIPAAHPVAQPEPARAHVRDRTNWWCVPTLVDARDKPGAPQIPTLDISGVVLANLQRVLNTEGFFDGLATVRYRHGALQAGYSGRWLLGLPRTSPAYDREEAARRRPLLGSGHRRPPVRFADALEKRRRGLSLARLLETALASVTEGTRVLFAPCRIPCMAQVRPGSIAGQRDEACKQRTARLAAKHGSPVIDMRFHSDITRNDENYSESLRCKSTSRAGLRSW